MDHIHLGDGHGAAAGWRGKGRDGFALPSGLSRLATGRAAAIGMDRALSRPMWMLALLAALLAALVLALLAGMRGGGAVEEARSPVQEEQRDVAGSLLAVSARQPGATRAGAAGPWQPTSPRPADAGDRLPSLAEGFEQADDLHAYLRRLLPAAQAGDAEAAWFVSRVYDYCAAHAADPAGYARDTDAL